jgi:predicted FMN-binding regulatory protein PaiB
MYTPRPFLITDRDVILSLIGRHSFATVVSQDADGAPVASHLPVLHRMNASGGDGKDPMDREVARLMQQTPP